MRPFHNGPYGKGALTNAIHRTQADAIMILASADARLADEYDAAQERGEVNRKSQKSDVAGQDNKRLKVEDLGLTRDKIHKARQIRDAEKAQPGVVRKVLDEHLERGEEPTKAALRKAVEWAAANPNRIQVGRRSSRRNPLYKPNPPYDRLVGVAGACRSIVEKTEEVTPSEFLKPSVDSAMRERTLVTLRKCRDRLTYLVGEGNA